jgi:hypothetical protein
MGVEDIVQTHRSNKPRAAVTAQQHRKLPIPIQVRRPQ